MPKFSYICSPPVFTRMTELEEGSGTEDYDDEILANSVTELQDVERYADLISSRITIHLRY